MKKLIVIVGYLFVFTALSCTKEYLEIKPDKALVVPGKLSDLDALLDNLAVMNITPALPVLATDEYWTDEKGLIGYGTLAERNSYTWQPDIFEGSGSDDWNKPYQQIFYANIVLDVLKQVNEKTAPQQWNRIKGSALFFRAWANFHLVNQFAVPYNKTNLNNHIGLPLRFITSVDEKVERASLMEFHQAILTDLNASLALLPQVSLIKSRPSALAAHALLAKIFLNMGEYDQALVHAEQAINPFHQLIDYKTLNVSSARPFPLALPTQNTEVIFYSNLISNYKFITSALTKVDPKLFNSYELGDLRKELFFTGAGLFKGSYSGNTLVFSGLALDEMYLIKIECLIRSNKIKEATTILNEFREKRFKKENFQTIITPNRDELFEIVIQERIKQLFSRGTRWTDLRRLNLEGQYLTSLKRIVAGVEYSLLPNDKRYTYPIPHDEIRLSGIDQNVR